VRLSPYSTTLDEVTVTIFQRPGEVAPTYVLCLDPEVSSPRILRAYHRRPWVEACFEVCKATLNIERFKVRISRGSMYGFIALRFLSLALFDYAGRRVTRGQFARTAWPRRRRCRATLAFACSATGRSSPSLRSRADEDGDSADGPQQRHDGHQVCRATIPADVRL